MPFSSSLAFIPTIGVLILAAVEKTTPAPADLTGLAAILTAAIGVFSFLLSVWRGRQNNQRVQEIEDAASYVMGFESLTNRLKEEINEVRREQQQERREWAKERSQLEEDIGRLRIELNQQIASNYSLQGELAELRGQIKGYLNAQQYEEFQKHFR